MSANNIDFTITGKFQDELTQATNKAKSSLESLKQTTEELVQSTNQVGGASTKGAKGIDKIKTSTAAAATKMRTFATALPGVINGLGNVASGAIMLYRNYRDMNDTQLQVMRQTRMLSLAQEAEAKAQEKVNTFVNAGDTSSAEYKQALLDLDQAKQKVAISTEALSEAEERHSDAITDVYLSVIPSAIGVIGTLASAILTYQANALTAATATNGLSTAAKAVKVAMMAIPLVAIAAALLAVKTNAGGFRDMLNELGEKIGNLIPEIKPLLQWIKDFAEALGLTEKKMDLKKAWKLLTDGFKTAWDTISKMDWGKILGDMVTKIETWVNDPNNWKKTGAFIEKSITGVIKWLDTYISPMLGRLATAMEKWASNGSNWVKLGTAIGSAIAKAVVFADDVLNGIAQRFVAALQPKIVDAIAGLLSSLNVGSNPNAPKTGAAKTSLDEMIKNAQTQLPSDADMKKWMEITKNTNQGKGGSSLSDLFTKGLPGAGAVSSGSKGPVSLDSNQQMIKALDQLKAYANTTTTQISSFFTTMESSIKLTMTRIGATFTTAFAALPQNATMATSQASAQFITMETSIKGTILRIAAVFPTAFTTLYTYATQATGQTIGVFTTLQTSIQQTLGTITTLFAPAFANLAPIVSQATSQASAAFVTMKTSIDGVLSQLTSSFNTWASSVVSASATAGNGVLNSFVKPASEGFKIFITNYTATAKGYEAFASSITKSSTTASGSVLAMKTSMTTNLSALAKSFSSFASSVVSALNKVASAAKSATSALNSMAAAARKAAAAKASVGFMHGGSFVRGQHGFSGVINSPTKYGGVQMGEGFRPELVTVTPLTRGTGNTGGLNRAMAGNGLGGGGGTQITNVTVVLDGRVIQRFVEKTALHGYNLQV